MHSTLPAGHASASGLAPSKLRLPVGPFADWCNRHPDDVVVLADRANISADRIGNYVQRRRRTMPLDIADRMLCANDSHLQEVWPDIDRLMGIEDDDYPASGQEQGRSC